MKVKTVLITSLFILACWSPASAQTGDVLNPDTVILTDEQGEYPLGLHMEILEDPGGELTVEDVSSPKLDSQFLASEDEMPNFGYTESAIWVRLRLRNESVVNERWWLDVAFANIHFVDLYTPLPDGEGFAVQQTGILRSPETRDIAHPHFVFDLTLPTNSQQTIYLRFQSGASLAIPITLWRPGAFLLESQWELVLHGLFYGVLIGLLFYNLFILISLQERSYLYLVILLASMIFFDAAYAGYLEVYFIPDLYYLRYYYMTLSFALIFVSTVLFTDTFLELKARLAKLHQVNIGILVVWGTLMLLIPFASYYFLATLMVPWALPSLLAVPVAGIVAWRRGFHPARFFLIAWLGLVVTFLLVLVVRLGFVPSTVISENAYRLGWVWMAVCWSIALADRINLMRAETESANRNLKDSEQRFSQILEGLPLGLVVYGKDQKPNYINRRASEILSNPAQGIEPDLSAGRTLAQATAYYSLRTAGSDQDYPAETLPVHRALLGEPAYADDIEADLVDKRIPLEIWASPVRDDAGNVQLAVVAFQDISQRKRMTAELEAYHKRLELLVEERTTELNAINERLSQEIVEREGLELTLYQRIEWLSSLNQVRQTVSGAAMLPQAYKRMAATIRHLFDANVVFLLRCDNHGEQMETLCCLQRAGVVPDSEGMAWIAGKNSPLRMAIEQGKPTQFSPDQAAFLPASLAEWIQGDSSQLLVLAPIIFDQSTSGLLGVAMPGPRRLTPALAQLVETMTLDLADLTEDAQLLDQARSLAAAEERNRLARDLHDSVTQVLFSASLVAEVLPQIWRRDPEKAMQSLAELRRLTRSALAEMRTMLLELRPSAVLKSPLPELLAQLTEGVTGRVGLSFKLSIEQIPTLPEDVHAAFYRIAQEALNNVVKHAQASRVLVSLSATPLTPDSAGTGKQEVNLVIEDNGVGYYSTNASAEHLGIAIMRERAAAVQATLFLDSRPGYGTRVTLIWHSKIESLL